MLNTFERLTVFSASAPAVATSPAEAAEGSLRPRIGLALVLFLLFDSGGPQKLNKKSVGWAVLAFLDDIQIPRLGAWSRRRTAP